MDELKKGMYLRSYGNKNPVVEYRIEGFDMFDAMIDSICEDTVRMLFTVKLRKEEPVERKQVLKPDMPTTTDGSLPNTRKATKGKPGRNDPCPCGSGKKYKKCCGANEN